MKPRYLDKWWLAPGMQHARCHHATNNKRCKNKAWFPSVFCKKHQPKVKNNG